MKGDKDRSPALLDRAPDERFETPSALGVGPHLGWEVGTNRPVFFSPGAWFRAGILSAATVGMDPIARGCFSFADAPPVTSLGLYEPGPIPSTAFATSIVDPVDDRARVTLVGSAPYADEFVLTVRGSDTPIRFRIGLPTV